MRYCYPSVLAIIILASLGGFILHQQEIYVLKKRTELLGQACKTLSYQLDVLTKAYMDK